ncbi:MAG: hypothetical protein ABIZ81_10740, partial [Opitutaceae bacterium]
MKLHRSLLLFLFGAVLVTSCSKKERAGANAHAGHDHSAHAHEHIAPHGGTPVVLGKEVYHLELVLNRVSGKLSAYVFDGEMDKYIRLATSSFEVVATVNGAKQTLTFNAVGDSATGEKIGDTALFEATAAWLKTTPRFDAVLTKIEIRGTTFSDVAFNFPKGND